MINVTKKISTPVNSNKFTDFDLKSKNFDSEKVKSLKTLKFSLFRILVFFKILGFLKRTWTALCNHNLIPF